MQLELSHTDASDPPASVEHSAHSAHGELTEDDLAIGRCQRGEIAALAPLVRRYHPQALRVAYLLSGDHSLAEDIAQEAFLRAFTASRRFRLGQPFLPWLLGIVTNLARQGRRTAERRREISLTRIVTGDEPGSASPEDAPLRLEVMPLANPWVADPVRAAEHSETRSAFVAALARLSAKQREAVVLRYYLGYGDQEIAQIVGCRPGAARQRLSNGLDALERIIRRDYSWLIDDDAPRSHPIEHSQSIGQTERRLTHGAK